MSATNIHNSLKFKQIFQIWYCVKQDNIPGEYVEFGVFKGKSLYHSWKCAKKLKLKDITFYGLDSFEGFPVENHNFYIKENFHTSYHKVEKTFKNKENVRLVKGFFDKTLNLEETARKLKKYLLLLLIVIFMNQQYQYLSNCKSKRVSMDWWFCYD